MGSKYHNRPAECDGYRFDSRAEMRRYQDLRLWEYAGEIADLQVHPRFLLLPAFRLRGEHHRALWYIGDFSYHEVVGGRVQRETLICEDVKGVETEAFRIKAKLMAHRHPHIELRIVKVKR